VCHNRMAFAVQLSTQLLIPGVAQGPLSRRRGLGVASGQAAQVFWREVRRVHRAAFVDSLGDGKILVHSACGDQYTALLTTRHRDGAVLRMDFVHKWGWLICEHIYLHIEGRKTSAQIV